MTLRRTTLGAFGLGFALTCLPGCKGSSGSTDAASSVASSFKMTGSSDAANVARLSPVDWMGWVLPRAVALTPPAMMDAAGASVSLSQAWVAIKEVEFKVDQVAESNEVEGSEVVFHGPYVVDLLSTSPIVLDTETLPSLPYHRIKLKLHRVAALPSGAPSELANQSIYVSAAVGGRTFKYESDDNSMIEIAGPNPVVPTSGSELLVSINLANVFKQIDLSSVTNNAVISSSNKIPTSGSKCPSVDAHAPDIYSCLRRALQKHANMGRDRHHDGHLDSAEDRLQ